MEMNNYIHQDNKYDRTYMLDPLHVEQEVTIKSDQQNVLVENVVSTQWSEHPYHMEDPKVIYVNEFIVKHSLVNREKILCIVCNVEFDSLKNAKRHSKTHESGNSSKSDKHQGSSFVQPKSCPVCSKEFKDQSSLNKHAAVEHKTVTHPEKVRLSTCEICYKTFAQPAHLTNHLLVHTGIRNYACQYCDKKFKQRGHVLNHQKIHLDEKNYKCTECGKAFRQTAHLRTHVKIHTGVKDHVCILCSKVFTQSGQLQTHMRTHTNERKYECHLCDMKFKQSGHLQSHVKRHEKKQLIEEIKQESEEDIPLKKIAKITVKKFSKKK